jgi:hypothetical protein
MRFTFGVLHILEIFYRFLDTQYRGVAMIKNSDNLGGAISACILQRRRISRSSCSGIDRWLVGPCPGEP